MSLLSGPYLAAAALLVIGGAGKALRPESTVRALRSLRLPGSAFLVRLLAAGELFIGGAAIATGDRLASGLLAGSYLAFAAFVVFAAARGGVLGSCGCFGAPDTPPSVWHVLLTTGASAVAIAAAFRPPGPLLDDLLDRPLSGLTFVTLTGCCVWFGYVVLTLLPRLSQLAGDRGSP